ncbi:hypothetical protein BJV78DRAFT_1167642 [Lactifluus subvellereus]|nr:hypothetical protein BJV78DRAFT_1167642 [Lactifluus subvellereus]
MPLLEGIQEYIESAEDYIYVSFSSAKVEMPNIQEAFNRLWADISRFGPPIPEIHLPGLVEIPLPPPPPPPPPPPGSLLDNVTDWAAKNPWKASSLSVGVVGIGLLVGYNAYQVRTQSRLHKRYHTASHERRQVVVLLGADNPVAHPLILALEKKGFIIIASVATPEAVDELERAGKGYVRALVLDPFEPATIPIFLRSLASTLSHRFPINIHGDPHASPATHPFVHSVVSLLSLSQFSALTPLEHVQLQGEYLKYLNATHITPLHIIQALLPLMRNSPSRTRDAIKNGKGKKSIVVCVPAVDARVGLPFLGPSSMSAAATLRAVEVLRREVRVAAATGGAEGMNDINVVSLEVGALDVPPFAGRRLLDYDSKEYTKSWTPSEKLAYGPAWELTLEGPGLKFQRKAQKVDVFVGDVLQIVSQGRVGSLSFCGLRFNIGSAFDWVCGGRYSVGSGAVTSSIVSHLPGTVLDIIINIPYLIHSIHKAVSQARAAAVPELPLPPAPAPLPAPIPPEIPASVGKETTDSAQTSEHERDASENGSEADVESNDGAGVTESWVSLKPHSTTSSSEAVAT